jgi:Zn-dependent protease
MGTDMQETNLITRANSQSGAFPRITFGWSWLIVLPALVWGVTSYYLPLLGGTLDMIGSWIVTLAILLLTGVSLALHVIAHLGTAWLTGKKLPSKMTLLIFGEAAQRWPGASSSGSEILIAIAGPLINLLLASLAYLIWNVQSNQSINLIALFLCGFNTWLFIINLIPAFPMDGGRIFRWLLQDLDFSPERAVQWGSRLGWIVAATLTGWGIFLILQHARFSWETGLITFGFVLLVIDGLRLPASMEPARTIQPDQRIKPSFVGTLTAGLLILVMLAAASSLLMTNNGLDAPGVALSVAPMVKVPDQYRHPIAGQFFLVTVVSQAPITAGEWVLGHIDPAIQIVSP